MTFWLDGEYFANPAAINIADRGFLLGDGVFETILVVNGIPAFWSAHLERLRTAMAALQLNVEVDDLTIDVILELVARNKLTKELAAVRITVSRGPGQRGLLIPTGEQAKPTILVTVSKYHPPSMAAPVRLAVSSFVRSEQSISSRHKTLNYLDNVLARNEVTALGCDDAVMLNSRGRVACVSMGNIFLLRDESAAATPAAHEGALKGIVRGILLEGASQADLSIEEGAIEPEALAHGGLFVTNSLLGVRPAFIVSPAAAPYPEADKRLRRLQSWYEGILNDDLKQRASDI